MKRTEVRLTVIGLMATIAGAALIMGVYRLSWRWADDWAFDRREAVEHRHLAENTYPAIVRSIRDHRAAHPDDGGGIWIVDGLGYRLGPDLDRYLAARTAYHRRQAERHEWAVGRRWAYVTAEAPPPSPPLVPYEEVARKPPK
jgi:hypothetical protein